MDSYFCFVLTILILVMSAITAEMERVGVSSVKIKCEDAIGYLAVYRNIHSTTILYPVHRISSCIQEYTQ